MTDLNGELNTRVVTIDGLVRLIVEGEIDVLTVEPFRQALLAGISEAGEELRLDLSGVRFLGSQGIAVLLEGQRAGEQQSVRLRIGPCSPEALRPLAAIGLLDEFGLSDSSTRLR